MATPKEILVVCGRKGHEKAIVRISVDRLQCLLCNRIGYYTSSTWKARDQTLGRQHAPDREAGHDTIELLPPTTGRLPEPDEFEPDQYDEEEYNAP